MFFLKIFFDFIKAINANGSPNQLAIGFAIGAIIGFTPAASLHNVILLILVYLLNVNLGSVFFGMFLFQILAIFLSYQAHLIGYYFLVEQANLAGFWTQLYNMPIIPWTRFNNTVVLGSLILGVLLFIPNFFVFKLFILQYRKGLNKYILKSKIVQMIKANRFYKSFFNLYQRYNKTKEVFK